MPHIYLYRDPVVFRKSYRGLAAIVEQELEHNPFDGALCLHQSTPRQDQAAVLGRQWFRALLREPGRVEIPLAQG
jgi:hypothetical protein